MINILPKTFISLPGVKMKYESDQFNIMHIPSIEKTDKFPTMYRHMIKCLVEANYKNHSFNIFECRSEDEYIWMIKGFHRMIGLRIPYSIYQNHWNKYKDEFSPYIDTPEEELSRPLGLKKYYNSTPIGFWSYIPAEYMVNDILKFSIAYEKYWGFRVDGLMRSFLQLAKDLSSSKYADSILPQFLTAVNKFTDSSVPLKISLQDINKQKEMQAIFDMNPETITPDKTVSLFLNDDYLSTYLDKLSKGYSGIGRFKYNQSLVDYIRKQNLSFISGYDKDLDAKEFEKSHDRIKNVIHNDN